MYASSFKKWAWNTDLKKNIVSFVVRIASMSANQIGPFLNSMAGSSIKESDLKNKNKTMDKPEQQQAGQGKGSPKKLFIKSF